MTSLQYHQTHGLFYVLKKQMTNNVFLNLCRCKIWKPIQFFYFPAQMSNLTKFLLSANISGMLLSSEAFLLDNTNVSCFVTTIIYLLLNVVLLFCLQSIAQWHGKQHIAHCTSIKRVLNVWHRFQHYRFVRAIPLFRFSVKISRFCAHFALIVACIHL